ncbi:hypothetical protein KJ636_01960 [Patescibacteria group bacterium]|nr:hypothetical protein [Patescibacteria group bacterium]MBU4480861.1 hypothetical protein [Patescibacteria group bacterium]
MVVLKTQELKIEEIEETDLKKKKEVLRIMEEIRKRHKIKTGKRSSTEIIRYFRDRHYR